MAAGGPASELIMFIVAVIIAGSVAGALAYVTTDIAHGMNDRGGATLANQLRTDFAIINDPNNIPVSGTGPYNYTFYIKNIGKEPIPFTANAVQVFINGGNSSALQPYIHGRIREGDNGPQPVSGRDSERYAGHETYIRSVLHHHGGPRER